MSKYVTLYVPHTHAHMGDRLYKELADIQYGRKAFKDWSVVVS